MEILAAYLLSNAIVFFVSRIIAAHLPIVFFGKMDSGIQVFLNVSSGSDALETEQRFGFICEFFLIFAQCMIFCFCKRFCAFVDTGACVT